MEQNGAKMGRFFGGDIKVARSPGSAPCQKKMQDEEAKLRSQRKK